jgi:beta-glucosidase
MPPYDDAVIKGVASVMISYSSWNGVKMHENRFLITDILKNKLKFRVTNAKTSQILLKIQLNF